MRWLATLLCASACAPELELPAELSGVRTAVLLGGERARVLPLDGAALRLTSTASTVLLFAETQDELRLSDAPAIVTEPRCSIDVLDTSRATETLCVEGERLEPCTTPRVLLEREPYAGVPCYQWPLDLGALEFNLERSDDPLAHAAPLVAALAPGRVLVGQAALLGEDPLRIETELQILDVSTPRGEPPPVVTRLPRRPDQWHHAIPRGDGRLWVVHAVAEVYSLDVATGSVTLAVHGVDTDEVPVAKLVSLARSPRDPEALLALTERCALLRREGDRWKKLVGPHGLSGIPEIACRGQLDWTDPDEAVAIGVADPPHLRAEQVYASLREVVRIRGDLVLREPLPFRAEDTEAYATALASYVAADGARVEVAVGVDRALIDDVGVSREPRRQPWFVRDPRAGAAWVRVEDEDASPAAQLVRLMPWRDGVVGVGGYLRAFSDERWRSVPELALSARASYVLVRGGTLTDLAPDGRGGFVAVSDEPFSNRSLGYRITWRTPRD